MAFRRYSRRKKKRFGKTKKMKKYYVSRGGIRL